MFFIVLHVMYLYFPDTPRIKDYLKVESVFIPIQFTSN